MLIEGPPTGVDPRGPSVPIVGAILACVGGGAGVSLSFLINSSGVGRSATCVRRITAISAAIIAFGALATSSKALSSICQVLVRTRMGRFSANPCPRMRSSGEMVGSSAASGVIFTTDTQCVISARSRKTAKGSAPSEYCAPNSPKAPDASPRIIMSKRSITRPRSARPSMART